MGAQRLRVAFGGIGDLKDLKYRCGRKYSVNSESGCALVKPETISREYSATPDGEGSSV
jgi:hypothetical protein